MVSFDAVQTEPLGFVAMPLAPPPKSREEQSVGPPSRARAGLRGCRRAVLLARERANRSAWRMSSLFSGGGGELSGSSMTMMMEGGPNHRGRHHQFVMGSGKDMVLEPAPLPSDRCGGTHRASLLEVQPGRGGGRARESRFRGGCHDLGDGVPLQVPQSARGFIWYRLQDSNDHKAGKISELLNHGPMRPRTADYGYGEAGTPAVTNGTGRRAQPTLESLPWRGDFPTTALSRGFHGACVYSQGLCI